jgi:hypothetical protein
MAKNRRMAPDKYTEDSSVFQGRSWPSQIKNLLPPVNRGLTPNATVNV